MLALKLMTVLLLLVSLLAMPVHAAEYEVENTQDVSNVIPAALIQGATWRVGERVVPVEGLYEFQISTPWGEFPVYGEAMLRLRLREFRAISELKGVSSTEAGLKGAGDSVKKSFVRLGNAFIHPKRTARAIPQGTRRLYGKLDRYARKIAEALDDSDDNDEKVNQSESLDSTTSSAAKEAAVWLAQKYGGVGSKSRRRAREVGVDPYTSNEVLAAELERLGKAEAVGSVSSKFLLPALAGGLGLMADAANIAYIKEWREIFSYNAGLMRDFGTSEDLILAFEVNEFLTPMTQTLLVAMLDAMEGAEDRAVVIRQASLLENESEALFFLESIMLAEWYHREQWPLEKFLLDTLIPVATNSAGNLVAFTAADYFYWTASAAVVAADFSNTYSNYPGGREFVCADYISPVARNGVEALGWTVMSDLRLTYDVEIPWGKQDR